MIKIPETLREESEEFEIRGFRLKLMDIDNPHVREALQDRIFGRGQYDCCDNYGDRYGDSVR